MSEIRFEEVRVGDRVRVTQLFKSRDVKIYEFVVTAKEASEFLAGTHIDAFAGMGTTIELLSRPVPAARCGDIREDPWFPCKFVRTNETGPGDVHWVGFAGNCTGRELRADRHADIIARLVPVEGAS